MRVRLFLLTWFALLVPVASAGEPATERRLRSLIEHLGDADPARRAAAAEAWEITWRPAHLSASFHGRDLFAPVAARLALGEPPPGAPRAIPAEDWPDDLSEVIYIDGFGNAMTGLRASVLPENAVLSVSRRRLPRARTFSDVAPGDAFWYDNANGLAEIAVNRGRAADLLDLTVGSAIEVEST